MSNSVNSCMFKQFEMHATRRILTRGASMSNIPAAPANLNFGPTSQPSNVPTPPPMPKHAAGAQPQPQPSSQPRSQSHQQLPQQQQQHHQHQQHAHFQMHQHHQQQLYMERMRGGVPMASHQTTNDYYYSEMHSTWHYSHHAAPYYTHMTPPQNAGATNMPMLPNLSVPPPPYGVYPINNATPIYSTGYAAAYQANTGYIGPNSSVLTNSVGAMGSMSSFSGGSVGGVGPGTNPGNHHMFVPTRSTHSSGASTSTSNNDSTTSSSSSFSSSSGTSPPSTSSSAAAAPKAASASAKNAAVVHKPKMVDASTQVDLNNNLNTSSGSSSSRSTQVYSNFKDLFGPNTSSANSSILGAGDADRSDDSSILISKDKSAKNAKVELSQDKLNEVTRVCLRGSEKAEKVAYVHRNRPCFKKIDSLCARMKQDLIRPDGVLPNINSQGIAWAVKDFIFVFTRIVNAWIIMKGYVYNTPDGLNKIKNVLPDTFMYNFSIWQDASQIFVNDLIQSFLALDNLVQKQKTSFNNSETSLNGHCNGQCNAKTTGTATAAANEKSMQTKNSPNGGSKENVIEKPAVDSLKKNYMYTMVEDSEATQRNVNANGTYLKTGTYRPLQINEEKSATNEASKPDASVAKKIPTNEDIEVEGAIGITNTANATLKASAAATATTATANINAEEATVGTSNSKNRMDELLDDLECNNSNMPELNVSKETDDDDLIERTLLGPPRWTDVDNLRRPRLDPTSIFGRDTIERLNEFSDRLLQLRNGEIFFKKDFTTNYFPDFMAKCKFDFVDLRHIILKCQNAQYNHLYEAVHDVRRICFVVKGYLQLYDDFALSAALKKFETEMDEILNAHPYINHQFDHIMGNHKEKLFNYII